ncbi:MAG: Gfo/Idh/MocA family oxidoreductase [Armatimonadetes bacterium]|nr:Gfo/Idh/MocA family oxidoreductase [Armatimonadota bacterium]
MSELKAALIGCGGMGTHLARTLHGIERGRIAAVADASPEAREKAAAEFGATGYGDYRGLLANEDIGAVLVGVPNHLHREVAEAAAAAGKHIFCEKPMALTVADCDRMIAAAEAGGVKLMVGQVLRLIPLFAKIREIVSSGLVGEPACLAITRIHGGGFSGWRSRKETVGGLLFEVSVHELDFMRSVAGEVASVYAVSRQNPGDVLDYEDTILVNLKFKSGAVGHLYASRAVEIGSTDGIIQCAGGTVAYNWGTGLLDYKRPGEEKVTVDPSEWPQEDGVHREIRSFLEWVLDGTPPIVTALDGRAAIAIVEAAYQSAATGRAVEVG